MCMERKGGYSSCVQHAMSDGDYKHLKENMLENMKQCQIRKTQNETQGHQEHV